MTFLTGIAFTWSLLLQFECMNKAELAPILDNLLPKLFSFAYSLIPDELQAEQMVIDAYSVFIIREKDYIENYSLNTERKKDRSMFRRFLMKSLLRDIYLLGAKRAAQLKNLVFEKSYDSYYERGVSERAILYMKDILGLEIEEIQEVMQMQKHHVIENIYNARNSILIARADGGDLNGTV